MGVCVSEGLFHNVFGIVKYKLEQCLDFLKINTASFSHCFLHSCVGCKNCVCVVCVCVHVTGRYDTFVIKTLCRGNCLTITQLLVGEKMFLLSLVSMLPLPQASNNRE